MIKLGDYVMCIDSKLKESTLSQGNFYKVFSIIRCKSITAISLVGLEDHYYNINRFLKAHNDNANGLAEKMAVSVKGEFVGRTTKNKPTDTKLFYIDVPKHFSRATMTEQWYKLSEEVEEVREALVNQDNENFIEECHDVIQAVLGLVELKGLKKEFKEGFEKHKNKMIDRGYELEEI